MKKLITIFTFALFCAGFLCSGELFAQTNFYSQGSLDITQLSSWNSERDGSGFDPEDFSTDGQTFNVQNGHTMTATGIFTVSGVGSRVNIETGGVVEASGFNHSMILDMQSGGTYATTSSYAALVFGTLNNASNFRIDNSSGFAFSRTYPNLIMNQAQAISFGGNLTVLGDFIIRSAGETRGTSGGQDRSHSIGGSIIIDGGIFVGSNNTAPGTGNAYFEVGGSLIMNSGTFRPRTATGTAIFTFTGSSATIDLSGGTLTNTDYVIIMEGSLSLLANFVMSQTLTLETGSEVSLNGNTLTLNGPVNFNGGNLVGSATSNLNIGSTATVTGNMVFLNTSDASRSLNNFTSGANITMGSRLHVLGNLTLTDGTFSLGANRLELSGELVMTGGTLNGGGTGRISVYGEEEAALELPELELNMLDIDRVGGVELTGAVTVNTRVVLHRGELINASLLTMPGTQKRVVVYEGTMDDYPNIVSPTLAYYGNTEFTTGREIPENGVVHRFLVYNTGGVKLGSDLISEASILLNDGNLDINGRTIDLRSKVAVIREDNGHFIFGESGYILTNRVLDNPVNFDHHNIGLALTFTGNLKNTEIIRGFTPYQINDVEGILRFYEINSVRKSNINLDATIVFSYLDSELNGNDEENLKLYQSSDDGNTWSLVPGDQSVDELEKTITVTGVSSLPRLITASSQTLDEPSNIGIMPGEITPEETLPEEYGIDQNYPNPFNPMTTIKYQMPENGNVSLKVFDLTGREVMNLVNGFKNAGFHTAQFDGNNLASGVYFYRLDIKGETQEFSRIMRMMLVK